MVKVIHEPMADAFFRSRNFSENDKTASNSLFPPRSVHFEATKGLTMSILPNPNTSSLPDAPAQQSAHAVRRAIEKMLASKEWFDCTPYEINNGLCDPFGEDVANACPVDEHGNKVFTVEMNNFKIESDTQDRLDWALLAEHWPDVRPPQGLSADQVNQAGLDGHVWITNGRLHWDAQCPQGVENFLELPLWRDHLGLPNLYVMSPKEAAYKEAAVAEHKKKFSP